MWPEALLLLALPLMLALAALGGATLALDLARALFWAGALVLIAWRWAAMPTARAEAEIAQGEDLPVYTVLAPLFSEAHLATDLLEHLRTLDYPADRLEVLALVQEGDEATATVVRGLLPPEFQLIRVPGPGRADALNAGLALARGDFLAVYDPEARPHAQQLRESIHRFSTGPAALACLQAPIRLRHSAPHDRPLDARHICSPGFVPTQLAAEYSVLYESSLPLLARLNAPFPLGDSSCHFRVEALRRIGGWAPACAAEDAEIAYRFARAGLTGAVLSRPTWRTPPSDVHAWLPQKTRWLTGHLQILAAHLSHPRGLGRLGVLSLVLTLGLGVASAYVQAPLLVIIAATLLSQALQGLTPAIPLPDALLLAAALFTAIRARQVAARISGASFGWRDAAFLPLYGALSTLAGLHAAGEVLVAAAWRVRQAQTIATPVEAAETGRLAA